MGIKGLGPVLDGELHGLVDLNASLWVVVSGELYMQLQNARKGESWAAVLEGPVSRAGRGALRPDGVDAPGEHPLALGGVSELVPLPGRPKQHKHVRWHLKTT